MLLNFETEAESLRPKPKGPKAKAEAKCYEAETEAKILASRPIWPWRFNHHFCYMAYNSRYSKTSQLVS